MVPVSGAQDFHGFSTLDFSCVIRGLEQINPVFSCFLFFHNESFGVHLLAIWIDISNPVFCGLRHMQMQIHQPNWWFWNWKILAFAEGDFLFSVICAVVVKWYVYIYMVYIYIMTLG